MPIAGVVTLYSSLLTFSLHVHPDRLDYVDQILVLPCKVVFSAYNKVPRSPTPSAGKASKCDIEMRRKLAGSAREDGEIPAKLLADVDSLFVSFLGLTLHYKLKLPGLPCRSLSSTAHVDRPLNLDKSGLLYSEKLQ